MDLETLVLNKLKNENEKFWTCKLLYEELKNKINFSYGSFRNRLFEIAQKNSAIHFLRLKKMPGLPQGTLYFYAENPEEILKYMIKVVERTKKKGLYVYVGPRRNEIFGEYSAYAYVAFYLSGREEEIRKYRKIVRGDVIRLLNEQSSMSVRELKEQLGISDSGLRSILTSLRALNVVQKVGENYKLFFK